MDVTSIKKDSTSTHLISPLTKPLTIEIYNDNNEKEDVIVPSMEIITYPKWKADIIKKHIVDKIIHERNLGYMHDEKRREIEKEVEVVIDE